MNFTRRERLLLLITSALNAWEDAHDTSSKLLEPSIPISMILELHEDLDDIMFALKFALKLLAEELLCMGEDEVALLFHPSNN